jgi:DNA-directed RNA polymerase subunit M/transcription elongation factor TFIIS
MVAIHFVTVSLVNLASKKGFWFIVIERTAKHMIHHTTILMQIIEEALHNVIAVHGQIQRVSKFGNSVLITLKDGTKYKQSLISKDVSRAVMDEPHPAENKLKVAVNALIYIKNKGFDINDDTGNKLGYIAQQTLAAIDSDKWATTSMECEICNHKWQAVHPVECIVLECPNCHYMNKQNT